VNKESFKSGFKNRQRVADRVPDRWCWKSESTAWKSLSWWTIGAASGWQMNVKFDCRDVPH